MHPYVSRLFLLVLSVAVAAAVMTGCAVDPGTGGTDGGAGLTEAEYAVLVDARTEYNSLKETLSAEEARTTLVNALNDDTPGIAAARLFEDGSTIFIQFERGTFGALVTADFGALAEGAGDIDLEGLLESASAKSVADPSPAKTMPRSHTISSARIPDETRILLLNPASSLAADTIGHMTAAEILFARRGWDTDTKLDEVMRHNSMYNPPALFEGDDPIAIFTGNDTSSKQSAVLAGQALQAKVTSWEPEPNHLLDLEEYGIIIILAHGLYGVPLGDVSDLPPVIPPPVLNSDARWKTSSDTRQATTTDEYYYILCGSDILSHAYEGPPPPLSGDAFWKAGVGEEKIQTQLADAVDYDPIYDHWYYQGKLISVIYTQEDLQDRSDLYMRQDLLAEEMSSVKDGIVYVGGAYSWAARYAFVQNNSGDFFGWEGQPTWAQVDTALLEVLQLMLASDPAHSDSDAFAALPSCPDGTCGLDLYPRRPLYMPAWAEVTVDTSGAPEGTAEITLELSYTADSYDSNDSHSETVSSSGGTVQFDDLVPDEVQFDLIAVNEAGDTLATGRETVQLLAGLNEVSMEFCQASASVTVDEYPQTGVTVSEVLVDLEYSDAISGAVAPEPFTTAPDQTVVLDDLPASDLTFTARAQDADGEIIGLSEQTASLDCGDNDVALCFGWVTVHSDEVPVDSTNVLVETEFEDSDLTVPAVVEYAPGSTATIVGFRVGTEVTFTATAENGVGQEQGTKTVVRTIECGENDVALDFFDYGIILEVSPSIVLADGTSTAVVTATLKRLTADDLLEPTGDPVPDKRVDFDTSLGAFVGFSRAVSDADGIATVELASTAEGVAGLMAFVSEDLVESNAASVRFGVPPVGVVVEASAETVSLDAGQEGSAEITATVRYWQDDDETEPTGDVVADREIQFATTMGTLGSTDPVTTDSSGTASVTVTVSEGGVATVTATEIESGESGSASVTFRERDASTYFGTLVCEVIARDYDTYHYRYRVYVEFDKVTTEPAPTQYQLEGYGFNDTLWYGTSHSDTGPPWAEDASCEETESVFKVALTGGSASGNPENNDKSDEEICAQPTSRFEGSIWEITPIY